MDTFPWNTKAVALIGCLKVKAKRDALGVDDRGSRPLRTVDRLEVRHVDPILRDSWMWTGMASSNQVCFDQPEVADSGIMKSGGSPRGWNQASRAPFRSTMG
jgi:hypothetical protein